MNKKIKISAVSKAVNGIEYIECANPPKSDLSKITGVAYSGGEIRQIWASYPMVVDLSGMEIGGQIPLLLNHENDPDCRIGEVKANISNNQLLITGGIDTADEEGRKIVEKGKKFLWQLSIGASVQDYVLLSEDESRVVNGRTVKGIIVVTKSKLREVSVVAVGADSETHMKIAASFFSKQNIKGANKMDENLKKFICAKYQLDAKLTEDEIKAELTKHQMDNCRILLEYLFVSVFW